MRTIDNYKLSANFSFWEFVEGTVMSKQGHAMNWKNIKQCDRLLQKKMAESLQHVRLVINQNFKHKNNNKEIGLEVTSGWRCTEWELFRGRSGKSQHPIAAADVIPTGVSKELSDEIILWLNDKYSPRQNGWNGGFAIKRPTKTTSGFAHFDIRSGIARWEY
jgi:hypothetical protein